ncbi:MAG: helix-turn-helix domain-containing protein [Armatimonadota bacterium]
MNARLFDQLIASVREGGAILRGDAAPSRSFVADGPSVKRLRAVYRLSQAGFAALLGISVKTLRNWEQGRRRPDGSARVLLQVAVRHPDAVWDVVQPSARRERRRAGRRSNIA